DRAAGLRAAHPPASRSTAADRAGCRGINPIANPAWRTWAIAPLDPPYTNAYAARASPAWQPGLGCGSILTHRGGGRRRRLFVGLRGVLGGLGDFDGALNLGRGEIPLFPAQQKFAASGLVGQILPRQAVLQVPGRRLNGRIIQFAPTVGFEQ